MRRIGKPMSSLQPSRMKQAKTSKVHKECRQLVIEYESKCK